MEKPKLIYDCPLKRTQNGVLLSPGIFKQYEFKGWLITIQTYFDELCGFATPTKYSHILDYHNYFDIDEIAKENGISEKFDEDGDSYYEDFYYLIFEPGDLIPHFLNDPKMKSLSYVLNYMVYLINEDLESK